MKQLARISVLGALMGFSACLLVAQPGADVMKVDEAYRVAKLNRDIKALDRILADGFNETNQNGNSRDKAQTIELWKSFSISSLTTDSYQVRMAGNTAMVIGTQTEDGSERMLFTRAYVKAPAGWQLLASMQYRDPNPAPPPAQPIGGDVKKVDEAYRLAKLTRDIKALERILADGFNETNQNGNSRDKAQTIELWQNFAISALTTDSYQVRMAGDTAMVIGTQTENGYEHMLFTRVYVKGAPGWQLLASMQYRDPRLSQNSNAGDSQR